VYSAAMARLDWSRGTLARGCGVLLVLLAAAACSSDTSKRADRDGSAGGDGDGDSPGKLPGGYDPRIECGKVGASCDGDMECGDGLECSGGTCLPTVEENGSCAEGCTKRAPLCVSNRCVSADQLGCMCLDAHGKEVTSECETLGELPAGECIAENGLCDTHPTSCCVGTSCIKGTDGQGRQLLGVCKKRCVKNDNCDTGCCLEAPSLGEGFCAETALCIERCRVQHEECDGLTRPCCEGMLCVRSETDPALNGCQPTCTKNSECPDTNCCVLFNDMHGFPTDNGVCAPADRCEGQ
jgi:hypothetical protein